MNSNKFYVYIIQSEKNNSIYVGYTENLKARIERHNLGYVISTKSRKPWRLIYCEYFINMSDAKAREKYLKSGYGQDHLKIILRRTLNINS